MPLKNLALIQSRIQAARQASPLGAPEVILLAASKGQPPEVLKEAIAAGITHFGENRVQEAEEKWPPLLARHPDVRLRLIGPLQSNKARAAVCLFDCIESVDRPSLAEALAEAMQKEGKRVPCLMQVNTGEEPQKSGVFPEEADALMHLCRHTLALPMQGLMCVPPVRALPAPHFALLHKLAKRYAVPVLSMGMSDDFEIAVQMGATEVRLGTALFGERKA